MLIFETLELKAAMKVAGARQVLISGLPISLE